MSSSNCCFLTCIQVSQEAGQAVWHSHLFKNFPQFIVIHTVKGFGIVNKTEIDVFLELSCFFDDPADVGNLTSGSPAFSKISLNIWKFTVHVLLKLGLENFERYFTSMWDECNCAVVRAFFGIAFLRDMTLLNGVITLLFCSQTPVASHLTQEWLNQRYQAGMPSDLGTCCLLLWSHLMSVLLTTPTTHSPCLYKVPLLSHNGFFDFP